MRAIESPELIINIENLKALCREVQSQKFDYDAILEGLYKDLYKADPTSLKSADELLSNDEFNAQVEQLIQYLSNTVIPHFDKARAIFSSPNQNHITTLGNFSQRNLIKQKLEKIAALALSNTRTIEEIREVTSDLKLTVCVDGIDTDLDEKLQILESRGQKALIAKSTQQVIDRLISKFINANKKELLHLFSIRPGNEVHNVSSLRNLIAIDWGLQVVTPEQDRYIVTADRIPEGVIQLFLAYINKKANTENFGKLLLEAGARIIERPIFDEDAKATEGVTNANGQFETSKFLTKVSEHLKRYDVSVYAQHLVIMRGFRVEGYKRNVDEILKEIMTFIIVSNNFLPEISLLTNLSKEVILGDDPNSLGTYAITDDIVKSATSYSEGLKSITEQSDYQTFLESARRIDEKKTDYVLSEARKSQEPMSSIQDFLRLAHMIDMDNLSHLIEIAIRHNLLFWNESNTETMRVEEWLQKFIGTGTYLFNPYVLDAIIEYIDCALAISLIDQINIKRMRNNSRPIDPTLDAILEVDNNTITKHFIGNDIYSLLPCIFTRGRKNVFQLLDIAVNNKLITATDLLQIACDNHNSEGLLILIKIPVIILRLDDGIRLHLVNLSIEMKSQEVLQELLKYVAQSQLNTMKIIAKDGAIFRLIQYALSTGCTVNFLKPLIEFMGDKLELVDCIELLDWCVYNNDKKSLEYIINDVVAKYDTSTKSNLLLHAIENKNIPLLNILLPLYTPEQFRNLKIRMLDGRILSVIQYALSTGCTVNFLKPLIEFMGDKLELVDCIKLLDWCVSNNDKKSLEYIINNFIKKYDDQTRLNLLTYVVYSKNIPLLNILLSLSTPEKLNNCEIITPDGKLSVIQYALSTGCTVNFLKPLIEFMGDKLKLVDCIELLDWYVYNNDKKSLEYIINNVIKKYDDKTRLNLLEYVVYSKNIPLLNILLPLYTPEQFRNLKIRMLDGRILSVIQYALSTGCTVNFLKPLIEFMGVEISEADFNVLFLKCLDEKDSANFIFICNYAEREICFNTVHDIPLLSHLESNKFPNEMVEYVRNQKDNAVRLSQVIQSKNINALEKLLPSYTPHKWYTVSFTTEDGLKLSVIQLALSCGWSVHDLTPVIRHFLNNQLLISDLKTLLEACKECNDLQGFKSIIDTIPNADTISLDGMLLINFLICNGYQLEMIKYLFDKTPDDLKEQTISNVLSSSSNTRQDVLEYFRGLNAKKHEAPKDLNAPAPAPEKNKDLERKAPTAISPALPEARTNTLIKLGLCAFGVLTCVYIAPKIYTYCSDLFKKCSVADILKSIGSSAAKGIDHNHL